MLYVHGNFHVTPNFYLSYLCKMQLLKNIVHISLAVLLLVATMGMSINKHYCMGQLKSVAIYMDAPNCFDLAGEKGKSSMGCCETTSDFFQVDDDRQSVSYQFDIEADYTLLYAYGEYESGKMALLSSRVPQKNQYYKPPIPEQDVLIKVQSFLI